MWKKLQSPYLNSAVFQLRNVWSGHKYDFFFSSGSFKPRAWWQFGRMIWWVMRIAGDGHHGAFQPSQSICRFFLFPLLLLLPLLATPLKSVEIKLIRLTIGQLAQLVYALSLLPRICNNLIDRCAISVSLSLFLPIIRLIESSSADRQADQHG